ncbi:hypothetical protein SPKIRA_33730 [Sphingomonas paucimobilis]|uniref:hypothetical protein n=1 Tax=Sphingomonas paucimobilis TaxID=13689 RepID=UPI0015DCEA73|nr:hypothetical protein SPKIRA_33730 [Sphingomonas paucimobilis]
MAYTDQKMSGGKVVAIVIVVLIHAALGYAFVTGLAYQYVKKATEKLDTFNVEEPPPPPPAGRTAAPAAGAAQPASAADHGGHAAADRERARPGTRGHDDEHHPAEPADRTAGSACAAGPACAARTADDLEGRRSSR